jgi:hypothetical protein
MKQKKNLDEVVTRRILKEELKNYPTKKDLQEALEKERHITSFQMDVRFESFMNQIKDMFKQQRSDIFSRIDPVLKEIENARLERAAARNESKKISEELVNHQKRIARLESHS